MPYTHRKKGRLVLLGAFFWSVLAGLALVSRGESTPSLNLQSSAEDEERGVQLYHERHYQEAVSVLERAVAEKTAGAQAWAHLGLARVRLNQLEEARTALLKALELDEGAASAHLGLGLVHGHESELDASIQRLKQAVELDPSLPYAHYHLGLAYNAADRTDLALLHLDRFLELAPDAPEAGQVRDLLSRLR